MVKFQPKLGFFLLVFKVEVSGKNPEKRVRRLKPETLELKSLKRLIMIYGKSHLKWNQIKANTNKIVHKMLDNIFNHLLYYVKVVFNNKFGKSSSAFLQTATQN